MGVRYRVGQFVHALRVSGAPPELGPFAHLLTAQQKALFATMAHVDQRHCLAVARALPADAYSGRDILCAALMHDIGKAIAPIAIWERVAYVVLSRCAPRLVGRLGAPRRGGFGHGLYVLAHHAELGASMAAQAGFSEATVALLRGAGDADLQAALQRADDSH